MFSESQANVNDDDDEDNSDNDDKNVFVRILWVLKWGKSHLRTYDGNPKLFVQFWC